MVIFFTALVKHSLMLSVNIGYILSLACGSSPDIKDVKKKKKKSPPGYCHHDLFIDFKFMSHKVKAFLVKLRWLQLFISFIDENPMCNKCARKERHLRLCQQCSYSKTNDEKCQRRCNTAAVVK